MTVTFSVTGFYDYDTHGIYTSDLLFSPTVYFAIFELFYYSYVVQRQIGKFNVRVVATVLFLRSPAFLAHFYYFPVVFIDYIKYPTAVRKSFAVWAQRV